jgi:hypothetical protein
VPNTSLLVIHLTSCLTWRHRKWKPHQGNVLSQFPDICRLAFFFNREVKAVEQNFLWQTFCCLLHRPQWSSQGSQAWPWAKDGFESSLSHSATLHPWASQGTHSI